MKLEIPPVTVGSAPDDPDSIAAAAIKALLAQGEAAQARERFDEIVSRHQRRAARIAYQYLRDIADVDEAVQDAFVKAFVHLPSFRQELPFVVWFTRIVINGCLDRLKARNRRSRWMVPLLDTGTQERERAERRSATHDSPEDQLLARERREHLATAIGRLPDRQRTVLILSMFDGRSAREVSQITGVNESTVRVHQFRAIRTLRKLLGDQRWLIEHRPTSPEAI